MNKFDEIDLSIFQDEDEGTTNCSKKKKRKLNDEDNEDIKSEHLNDLPLEDLYSSNKIGVQFVTTKDNQTEYWITCPIGVKSHREGVCICHPLGKSSLSKFKNLGYDPISNTSLIECRPYTGRTHQLRLHLQLCGNPIANDPCYGGELFFLEDERKDVAIQLYQTMKTKGIHPMSKVPHILLDSQDLGDSFSKEPERDIEDRKPSESDNEFLLRTCRYCKNIEAADFEHLMHCDGIWLHALRYSGSTWSFETKYPSWAKEFENIQTNEKNIN